ncbi:hypothetical protein ACFV0Z_08615 [Streptomyces xiamenensis]|uniref:hypothetical protein n=1 Tax=Streptomyces xiamenensis TaxID=408015 RepID=UPI00369D6588
MMMWLRRYRLLFALGLLATLAGLLVLNQCSARSGGGQVTVGAGQPGATGPTGADGADGAADDEGREAGGGAGEREGEGATDPDPDPDADPGAAPQGSPAGGSASGGGLTAEQRAFVTELSDSPDVPAGTDPAAVLEIGTEACERLGYLDRHATGEEITGALRDGEIPQAETAIENLCPEYGDLLDQARGE